MEDIRFYDFNFNLLHIESRIKSSNWLIYYNDIGKFELHFNAKNTELVDLILNHDYLIAVQGDMQSIITSKSFVQEGVIYGKTLNYLLYQRVTPQFKDLKSDVETMARQFVTDSCGDFITLGPVVGFTDQFSFWRNTYHPTSDVVRDCLKNDNAGYIVKFDPNNKQWIFQVLKGQQNPLVLSYGNRNVISIEYTEDGQNYYTGGWYQEAQEPDESGNTPEPIWKYITKDSSITGINKRDTVLSSDNETEATQELNKKEWEKKSKIKTQKIEWKKDYELGDVVRVQNQIGNWNHTENQRIIGIQLWFEDNDVGEQPILEVV